MRTRGLASVLMRLKFRLCLDAVKTLVEDETPLKFHPRKQCAAVRKGRETDGEGGQERQEALRANAGANQYPVEVIISCFHVLMRLFCLDRWDVT